MSLLLPLRYPPELLRAGRRHLVLQYLRQELTAIASSLKDTEGDSSRGDHAGDEQRQYQQALAEALGMAADAAQPQQQLLRMPSRTQLEALGRGDLVALVAGAGGFAEVGEEVLVELVMKARGLCGSGAGAGGRRVGTAGFPYAVQQGGFGDGRGRADRTRRGSAGGLERYEGASKVRLVVRGRPSHCHKDAWPGGPRSGTFATRTECSAALCRRQDGCTRPSSRLPAGTASY